jgi:chromosome segregation ATPase
MRPWAVLFLVAVVILIGFGIGYFWRGGEEERLREELGEIKSSLGVQVDTLRNEMKSLRTELEDAERRFQEEQATRKMLEEELAKARVWK